MSLNGISTLSTKEEKQIAKLNQAAADRDRIGNRRSAYDISLLPTRYSGNDIVDNSNAGGLVLGRPWTDLQDGIYQYHYNGYWNNNVSFFTSPTGSTVATNFEIGSVGTSHSEMYVGYFKPDYTGTWTFYMTSDDSGMLWIGPNAVTGYTTSNKALAANVQDVTGTIDLQAGSYYPIRVMFGNNAGPGQFHLSYSYTGQAKTNDFTGKLFYNPVTNGI